MMNNANLVLLHIMAFGVGGILYKSCGNSVSTRIKMLRLERREERANIPSYENPVFFSKIFAFLEIFLFSFLLSKI